MASALIKRQKKSFRALGLMSGTSLDGLDIACVEFTRGSKWSFKVIDAVTLPYDKELRTALERAHTLPGDELMKLHAVYGKYLGKACRNFVIRRKIRKIDLIASHGHTIFHQPARGFTFQLGDGSAIHAEIGIPVVFDFRSLDVQLGGEGAPLVPVGDRYLFSSADVCLNLGGIANVSMEIRGTRKAFDLCFCNMALNFLAREAGGDYDRNGQLASLGNVNPALLYRLEGAYDAVRSKRLSLGREIFEQTIQPLLTNRGISLNDRMRTTIESVAIELERSLPPFRKPLQILTTGGGAHNPVLVSVIKQRLGSKASVKLPSPEIIDFKEAIIFAFLGVLRLRKEINVLSSVTRARRDSCSGVVIAD